MANDKDFKVKNNLNVQGGTIYLDEGSEAVKLVGNSNLDLYSDNLIRFYESDSNTLRATFDLNDNKFQFGSSSSSITDSQTHTVAISGGNGLKVSGTGYFGGSVQLLGAIHGQAAGLGSSGSNISILRNVLLTPSSEDGAAIDPLKINDMAGVTYWGEISDVSGFYKTRAGTSGSYTYSNAVAASDAGWPSAFDGTSSTAGSWYTDDGVDGATQGTGTFTVDFDDQKVVTWTANVGIVFGSAGFTAEKIKIECYRNGAWQTECDISNNTDIAVVRRVANNNGSGVTKVRYTIGSAVGGSYFRIHSCFITGNAAGHHGTLANSGVFYLPKYGDAYQHGSFIPSLNNTYNIGNATYKHQTIYAMNLDAATSIKTGGVTRIDSSGNLTNVQGSFLGLSGGTLTGQLTLGATTSNNVLFLDSASNKSSYTAYTSGSSGFSIGIPDETQNKLVISSGENLSGNHLFTLDSTGAITIAPPALAGLQDGLILYDRTAGNGNGLKIRWKSGTDPDTAELYGSSFDELYVKTGGADRGKFGTAGLYLNNGLQVDSTTSSSSTGGVNFTITDDVANQAFIGVQIDHNISGSQAINAGEDYTHIGLMIDQDSSSTHTGTDPTADEHRTYGLYVDSRGGGVSDLRRGVYSYVESQHSSGQVSELTGGLFSAVADELDTGKTSNVHGVYGLAQGYATGTGGASNFYGGYFKSILTTAHKKATTNVTGIYADVEIDDPSEATTVDSLRAFWGEIDNDDTGDNRTITNSYLFYGNYLGDLPATNNYGVFIADDVRSYFSGSITTKAGTEAVPSFSFNGDTDTGMWKPAANTIAFSTNGGERVRIASTGKVGIGTDDPQAALDVDWDAEGVATDSSGIRVRAYRPHINLIDRSTYGNTNGHNFQIKADIAKLSFNATSADNEVFDVTRMVIDKDGNVGIGTDAPAAKLDVEGGGLGGDVGDTTTAAIFRAGRQNLVLQDTRTATGTDWSNATFKIIAQIDTTNHQSIDFVNDSDANEHIDIRTGNQVFNTRFTHDGKVGIGTNSPATKLAVSGIITATGGNSTNWNTAHGWGDHANTYLPLSGGTLTGAVSGTSATFVQQISATGIVYPLTIAATDVDNTVDQVAGDGVGLQFKLADNEVAGGSFLGASIVATRVSASDADSDTSLDFYVSNNDETLDKSLTLGPTLNAHFRGHITQSSGSITAYGNVEAGLGHVKSNLGYLIDTTTVIDSSRNLTNIGTISSGIITATGGTSTNWNTAYGWGDHASAGYSDEYKNYSVASGAEHDTHHWNKTHAAYSNNGASPTYIVLTTNVPQDNYSMGGFTLVFQNYYNDSDEGDTVKIYGYWNPESNGGFVGFRYHTSNPECNPTIQVGRDSNGKTVFLISGESSNYAQVIAKDFWTGYSAASASSSWGDSWAFSEASATTGISYLNTLTRVGITATQVSNWNTAYTYSQVGHLPLSGGTLTGALVGTTASFIGGTTKLQITQSGTVNQLISSTGSFAATPLAFKIAGSEAMRITAARNVGIGTTSPNAPLEIHGADIATGATTTASSVLRLVRDVVDPTHTLRKDSAVDFMLSRQEAVANNLPYTRLDIRLSGTTDSSSPTLDVMSLLHNGQVGINNTNPTNGWLSVVTPANNGGKYAAEFFGTLTYQPPNSTVHNVISNGVYIQAGGVMGGLTDYALLVKNRAATSTLLSVRGSGNVGIGTATPSQSLEVAGNIQATGSRLISALYDSDHYMRIEGNSSGGVLKGTDGGVVTTLLRTYGPSYFTGGNFGIGTSSPLTPLHIERAGGGSAPTDVLTIETTRSDVGAAFTGGAIKFVNSDPNSAGMARIKVGSSNAATDNPIGYNSEAAQSFIFETSVASGVGITSVDGDATTITVVHTAHTFTVGQKIAINQGSYAGSYYIDTVTSNTQFTIADTEHDLAQYTGAAIINYGTPRDSMIIRADGNVGIGTLAPTEKLHVEGNMKLSSIGSVTLTLQADSDNDTSEAEDAEIKFQQDGTHNILHIGGNGDLSAPSHPGLLANSAYVYAGNGHGGTVPLQFGTNSQARMILTTAGKLGIGTTTPSSNLHIRNQAAPASDLTMLTLQNGNSTGDTTTPDTWIDFVFQDGNSNEFPQARIGAHAGDGGDASSQLLEGTGYLTFHTNTAATITGEVNPSEKMRITHDGHVGIGNTSPTNAILSVVAPANNANVYAAEFTATLPYQPPNSTVLNTSSNGVKIRAGGSILEEYALRIQNQSGLSELFSVTGDGDVGIGTNTPQDALDVVGTVRISANLRFGTGQTVSSIETAMATSPTDTQLLTAQGVKEYVDNNSGGSYGVTAGGGLALDGNNFELHGSEIAGSINLNSMRTTGIFPQNSNNDATSGSNYPEDLAGILEVIEPSPHAGGNALHTIQRYSIYNSTKVWHRYYYNGTWSSWVDLTADTNTTYTAGDGLTLTGTEFDINKSTSGDWWGDKVVHIPADGVVEVGKYIDWHSTDAGTSDYDYRMTAGTNSMTFSDDLLVQGELKASDNFRVESSGDLLKVNITAWSGNAVQSILHNGYGSNTGDNIVLKCAGNGTSHGAIFVGDNVFSYGRCNSAADTDNIAANPLPDGTAFSVTNLGAASFEGSVSSGSDMTISTNASSHGRIVSNRLLIDSALEFVVGSTQGTSFENSITCTANGSTSLYYNGSFRLGTTTGGVLVTGDLDVNGSISGTTKSFDIKHPTKKGKRLHHGVLEGPEHAVYIRGRSKNSVIELPDYWLGLVHEETITVQLTAIGKSIDLYVKDIVNNTIEVENDCEYFYFIQAERKDVERFEVEYNEK